MIRPANSPANSSVHRSKNHPMNVLVIGNGGREHALAWSLLKSPRIQQLYCAPGNGGTAMLARCQNLAIAATDFPGLSAAVRQYAIDLVVVGPEVPLAQGITDVLQAQGVAVFGPTRAGAQLEASKSWAKALMLEAQVPTAQAVVFAQAEAAKAYVKTQGAPIVIKADGLAAGKGVTVATTVEQAIAAIDDAFGGAFGDAGHQVVLEACLVGAEASVLAFADGKTVRPLVAAQDHKRIGEGDTGPNTGGMGAYAPAPLVTPALLKRIEAEVLQPTLAALTARGIDYRGILYAGLMITPEGDPQVIEFNCRFGDPETQVLLPLLETPLLDLIEACLDQRLAEAPPLAWKPGVAATVVAAAGGYPGPYRKGDSITGLEQAQGLGAQVFQAGTTLLDGELVTDGGRILAVTQVGETFDAAFEASYQALDAIRFDGCYYRRDIGYQVRSPI